MSKTFDIELEHGSNTFKDYYNSVESEEHIRFLPKVNNINVFIGANNSGKSRFLRNLMSMSEFDAFNQGILISSLIAKYNKLLEEFNFTIHINSTALQYLNRTYQKDVLDKYRFLQNEKLHIHRIENKPLVSFLSKINDYSFIFEKINLLFEAIEKIPSNWQLNYLRSFFFNDNTVERGHFLNLKSTFLGIKEVFNEILELNNYKTFKSKRIYIPTLRTAHSLFETDKNISQEESMVVDGDLPKKKINHDIFKDTIKKNYKNLDKTLDIFTGLNLYNEIVNVRNSIKEERRRFHEFEKFLSKNFFDGDEVDIVAKYNIDKNSLGNEEENLIQVYIGGKSRSLHDLGDGVQSLIILMYKIFLAEREALIFIDEPELNLHPGYQRLFLEQITTNPVLTKKNLTYFIVTHSNHFLDLTLEENNISIYSFSSFEKDKFLIKNVNAGDNQVLKDLGVNNSSVFLANCSIWVEGVSDRNYIKAFLIAYCKGNIDIKLPREDIDFAFFEYAGSNLSHYDFKKNTKNYDEAKDLITSYALNNNVYLLSDLDSGKDAKHKNLSEIAENVNGFEYKTTKPYREIENLLPIEIWDKVLLNFCDKNKIKDNENNVQNRISESLKNISKDYKQKYIGEFLSDLKITELKKIFKVNENGESGTLIPKAELSQLVLDKVRKEEIKWNDFEKNETIVEITKSVYKFILKSKT